MTTPLQSSPPPAYRTLIDPLIDHAREALEAGKFLPSIAHVGSFESGQIIPVGIDTRNESSKDYSALGVRTAADTLNADFVFVVMEAWSLRQDKVAVADAILEKYGSISASPYCVDVLSFCLETKYGFWMAQAPIKPKGISKKKRTFATPVFYQYTNAAGRFAKFLKQEPQGWGGVH